MTTKTESTYVNIHSSIQFDSTTEKKHFSINDYNGRYQNRWRIEEFAVCDGKLYVGLRNEFDSYENWVEDKEIVRLG